MSKLKLFLLFVIIFAVTFAVVLYFMQPSTFTLRVASIWQSILTLPKTLNNLITNPTAAIGTLSMVGGATAGAAAIYRQLKQTRQQAGEAISQVSTDLNQARTEAKQLKADLNELKITSTGKINTLQTEKLELQNKLATAEEQVRVKEAEVQKYITERNAADRIAAQTSALVKKCPSCNQNILPGQTYCQYCGKELILQ